MKGKIDKLREKLLAQKERDLARARENARKRMAKGAKLAQLIRNADNRTKILAGVWALGRAEQSDEFRDMMMRELDRVWLFRDDDRELFGFPLLEADEKARREKVFTEARLARAARASAADALPDASESAPLASAERERANEPA